MGTALYCVSILFVNEVCLGMLLGECLEYVHKSRVPVSQVSDASLHISTTYSLRHTETVKLFHIGWDSLSFEA